MRRGGVKVIHINYLSARVDEIYFPQQEVIGDIANSLWQITEGIKVNKLWDFTHYRKVQKDLVASIENKNPGTKFPIQPERLVSDVRKVMPDNGIIALDNGLYKISFARNYRALGPNTILLDNALATMGAGLPSAMAAKIVHPERKIMAIVGDGGFMMNSQELETAVRLKLDLTVLILRDDAYGMIKWKQAGGGFKDFGLDFGNPDFVKYAESYGAKGHRVTKTEELEPLLRKCIDSKGVQLVEAPIDYSADF